MAQNARDTWMHPKVKLVLYVVGLFCNGTMLYEMGGWVGVFVGLCCAVVGVALFTVVLQLREAQP